MVSVKRVRLALSQTMAPPLVKHALLAVQELREPALDVKLEPSQRQRNMNATTAQKGFIVPTARAISVTTALHRTVLRQPANHVRWGMQALMGRAQHVHWAHNLPQTKRAVMPAR